MRLLNFTLFILFSLTVCAQQLNNFGHIIPQKEPTKDNQAVYSLIQKTYPTNTLYELKNGLLAQENTCGNTPTTLRFFNKTGELENTFIYKKTINLKTNPSNQYVYFQNGNNTIIINTDNYIETKLEDVTIVDVAENGAVTYYNNKLESLILGDKIIKLPFIPIDLVSTNKDGICVFGKFSLARITNGELHTYKYGNGTFFEAKNIDKRIHFVTKKSEENYFNFELNRIDGNKDVVLESTRLGIKEISKYSKIPKTKGGNILCPMYPDSSSYPFRIGNSYAQYQRYGAIPYLHPGIDILGDEDQPVYSPVGGVVKAVLTTGGDIYWRLALGLSGTAEEQEGYLFAHLRQETIPYTVGDTIIAGSYIGSLIFWPTQSFHHLHFARIQDEGITWDGDWLTKDNILKDIINYHDDSAPIFEKLDNENTIAFRADDLKLLDHENLSGQFDIVCNIYDYGNSNYKVDVNSIWFEIIDLGVDSIVHEQHSFTYDFELDVYSDGPLTLPLLNTIYSTTGFWTTEGDYNSRKFYQQISRSNGDNIIDSSDSENYFESRQIPNGNYLIKVCADDAAGNTSCTEQRISINNEVSSTDNLHLENLTIYPIPSSGTVYISIRQDENLKYKIINIKGQVVKTGFLSQNKPNILELSDEGNYYLQVYDNGERIIESRKIVILK